MVVTCGLSQNHLNEFTVMAVGTYLHRKILITCRDRKLDELVGETKKKEN